MSKTPYPLPDLKAGNQKRLLEGQPISPTHSPGTSPPTPEPTLNLPEVMDLPEVTSPPTAISRSPGGAPRSRLRRLLSNQATAADGLGPLGRAMACSSAIADEVVGEILQTTGRCGPISESLAILGAKYATISGYLLDNVDTSSKTGRQDLFLSKACTDTARLCWTDAMKVAVQAVQLNPGSKVDPTDTYLTAPNLDEEPEPT